MKKTPSESAFYIQSWWRNRHRDTDYRVKVYYTSITGQSHLIRQNHQKVDLLLHFKDWLVQRIDIAADKAASKFVQTYRSTFELPLIFINGYFIGGAEEIQYLEDHQLLEDIYNQTYLDRCLHCDYDRQEGQSCPDCHEAYLFFKK